MPFPVSHITAFVLLLHMLLGCCLHHAHTCEMGCCSEPAAAAEPCGSHAHQHADHDDHSAGEGSKGSDPGEHPHKHHCNGERCTFIQKQPSPEQLGVFAVESCPLEVAVSGYDADAVRVSFEGMNSQPVRVAGNSLRTHLALRVLLI